MKFSCDYIKITLRFLQKCLNVKREAYFLAAVLVLKIEGPLSAIYLCGIKALLHLCAYKQQLSYGIAVVSAAVNLQLIRAIALGYSCHIYTPLSTSVCSPGSIINVDPGSNQHMSTNTIMSSSPSRFDVLRLRLVFLHFPLL